MPRIPFQYLFRLTDPPYDGDTLKGDIITPEIDAGFNRMIQVAELQAQIRLSGVNTPEVRGVQRPAGLIVRDFVRRELAGSTHVVIKTHKDETGKYDRPLAEVYYLPPSHVGSADSVLTGRMEKILSEGRHLNALLLNKGYGLRMNDKGQTLGPGGEPMTRSEIGPYWQAWLLAMADGDEE